MANPVNPPQWTPDEIEDPPTPGSFTDSEASTPQEQANEPFSPDPNGIPKRVPSLRSVSDPQATAAQMSASSTHMGLLNNARRPMPPPTMSAGQLPAGLNAKMKAFHLSRQGSSGLSPVPSQSPTNPMGNGGFAPGGAIRGGIPAGFKPPQRPTPSFPAQSEPSLPSNRLGKKFKFKLSDIQGGGGAPGSAPAAVAAPPKPTNQMQQFEEYIDSERGYLTFKNKAVITNKGVNFEDGTVFRISLDEVEKLDELGKGNYGTVYKVRHSKPRVPRFGPGLSGAARLNMSTSSLSDTSAAGEDEGAASGVVMAMKEIRLELDEAKLGTILKELVILHECASPYIIDFYGAFFQESAVYMCLEYMDGGSIDKLYSGGIPETVLQKITYCTVMGLKELKDKHNIIHRDVKPTNILANSRGQVKICDFGVSGNLVASIAKTNIGCQSYMAPERISGGSFMTQGASDGTYSVQSDIWSLGLTIIECAMGKYPYPPDVSATIFSQLSAIVDGEPPDLPEEGYSETARTFVHGCLNKIPKLRPTYQALLASEWLQSLAKPETITEEEEEEEENDASAQALENAANNLDLSRSTTEDAEVAAWVQSVLAKKVAGEYGEPATKPPLHAAPLDQVSPLASPHAERV
ncbi:map kinase [Microdochium trichocladiopsis]|uniref:mitogen-activated protein kinase kinase n=1 Tax=Microdochium trichocladiopsis TaxID=1682393 RepID=A0A9P8YDW4_9PEZI|nr:map kinase [Microdochium trichocladiopsis]KAH7037206.1 map kinase [Microdochium trichocladiopsis]